MRKPRDIDSEMKALHERAKLLKERKLTQLGALVVATGADVLSIEQLAGLLLAGVGNNDGQAKQLWRKRGAAFFQRETRAAGSPRDNTGSPPADDDRNTTAGG